MTGIYQDHLLQEMRKTRIALENIAKSLDRIDTALNKKKTISDYISVTDGRGTIDAVDDMVRKADKGEFDTEETDIRETMHDFMKKWGEQNGLIDED